MKLSQRYVLPSNNTNSHPYGYSCSLRCNHPLHAKQQRNSAYSRGRSEDFIPEHIYKKYTETDSRPLTPELRRRSVSLPRRKSIAEERRRCVTPEPETKQCQFHHRRTLILDLRRVKSVDGFGGRRGSRTPDTSIDSTYGDDDMDRKSSSSMLFQFSPHRLSLSRSVTPVPKPNKINNNSNIKSLLKNKKGSKVEPPATSNGEEKAGLVEGVS